MRIGHWDARFGISGDMALASALDAGASLDAVNAALALVGVPGLRVERTRVQRCSLSCCRVAVRWDGDGEAGGTALRHEHHYGDRHHEAPARAEGSAGGTAPAPEPSGAGSGHAHGGGDAGEPAAAGRSAPHAHRTFADVRVLLSALPTALRERALAVFARLAEAEAAVHGRPPDVVHFHEVGGEDAIGDVVGTCAALGDLGIEALTVSPLPAGGGTVRAAHGELPVPAPAAALLLRGFDIIPGPVAAELVTPTGAALVAALARPSPRWPAMRLAGSGWGAGTREFPDHPNACRLVWGDAAPEDGPATAGWRTERLVEIETHVDDQTPEGLGHLFERLLDLGALDVAVSPVGMKKQRPGARVWALVRTDLAEAAARCLFVESTALGLRVRPVDRWSLQRDVVRVGTPYGEVGVKLGRLDGQVVNAAPEYEDCRRLASEAGVPLKAVMAAALRAAPWPPDAAAASDVRGRPRA